MKTDELIECLARDGVGHAAMRWTWPMPLAAAMLLSTVALSAALGPPFSALPQTGTAPFLMKLAFAAAVAIIGAVALRASGIPGKSLLAPLTALAIPFVAVGALAGLELAAVDPPWPGQTWAHCVTAISLLVPPIFATGIITVRGLAPTRLRLVGALAGLVAGGIAAASYALWCPETTALFLLSWYAVPILAAGALGALLGPRLLRW